MSDRTLRDARYKNQFKEFGLFFPETEEYTSQKSRCLANLKEVLSQVTRCETSGDVLALKNLCARLRHPLKSLNNPRLDSMVNEICFDENESPPAKLTQSLEMLCRQLIDEIRGELERS